MIIKEIEVKNFKSFDHLKLEMGQFSVFVGPNAAGKSNLVEIFNFLKDISTDGLDNAISMQGREYLSNISIGNELPTYVKVILAGSELGLLTKKFLLETSEIIYELQITFTRNATDYWISQENITCSGGIFEPELKNDKITKKEDLGKYKYKISRSNGHFNIEILEKPENISIQTNDILPPFLYDTKELKTKDLLLNIPFLRPPIQYTLGKIAVYNFDPKLSKKAVPVTGRAELENNAENFAIVLKNITEDKLKEKKLHNLIKDVLPFVSKLGTERFADKSLLFKLQETYYKKHDVPAPFISDGTINLIAMIVALYFEEKTVTVIEEPERYIHPHLIAKIVEMMKDASRKRQVLVTTHSSEVLKHAGLENLYCISRTEKGFSSILKPSEMENVKVFLKNDMGIEQLFIDNMLGNCNV